MKHLIRGNIKQKEDSEGAAAQGARGNWLISNSPPPSLPLYIKKYLWVREAS